jgi:hypothetical protein
MGNSKSNTTERKILNEEPLLILPSIAKVLGLNEAVIIQQLHYWQTINVDQGNNFEDGYHWTFNSIKQWQNTQFPFWSPSTIERALRELENKGIVVTGRYNKRGFDRTKWYRLNYSKIIEACPSYHNGAPIPSNCWNALDQNDVTSETDHSTIMTSPIPETTNTKTKVTENTSVTNKPNAKTNDGSGSCDEPSPYMQQENNNNSALTSQETPAVSPSSNSLTLAENKPDNNTIETKAASSTNQLNISAYLAVHNSDTAESISLARGISDMNARDYINQQGTLFKVVSKEGSALKEKSLVEPTRKEKVDAYLLANGSSRPVDIARAIGETPRKISKFFDRQKAAYDHPETGVWKLKEGN